MVIGHEKGRETSERVKRNFGMPHPSGFRKANRLMKLAEKFNTNANKNFFTIKLFSSYFLRISHIFVYPTNKSNAAKREITMLFLILKAFKNWEQL